MEMMEDLIQSWRPFSSALPFTYSSNSVVIGDDMEMETDSDPGVSETTFDWTEFLEIMPLTKETTHACFPGLRTTLAIPAGVYLGDLIAERKYIWEVPEENQENILWVWEDCVLDCSCAASRNLLTYAREGFYEGVHTNARLFHFTDGDGETHVGLETTQAIPEGGEIVYWRPEMI